MLILLNRFVTIARPRKDTDQTRVHNTRSRTKMDPSNSEPGRNLSMEVDEVRGRLNEVSETQTRMEEMLRAMKESLDLLGNNRTSERMEMPICTPQNAAAITMPMFSNAATSIPQGADGMGRTIMLTMPVFSNATAAITQGMNNIGGAVSNPLEQPHQTTPPIGEGYHAIENAHAETHGHAIPIWGQPHVSIPVPPTGFHSGSSHAEVEKEKLREEWMEKIQEQIKAIQGPSTYGPVEVEQLCPPIDVVVPKDFKIPEFSKYDGSGNPLFHLKSYCTKMVIWSKDERFLISFFHESLVGPALEWYIQLDHSKISCWRDLADLFMGQYQFNLEVAPTREQLSTMQKKKEESFKQYAQRWRALAAQVQPPLIASEMCSYFLGTLGSPFIGAMAGAAYKDFSDLITAGERIEILARAGKLPISNEEVNQPKKGFQPKKKESEVNYVQGQQSFTPRYAPSYPRHPAPPYQTPTPLYPLNQVVPTINTTPNPQFQINSIPTPQLYPPARPTYTHHQTAPPPNRPNYTQSRPNFLNQSLFRFQNLPPFPKLSISNSDLFQRLFDAHLISPNPVRPMEPPFPVWYNPNLTCKYHMGVAGHSIEDCEGFKIAVRKLIACGRLDLQEETKPDIVNNPIPNHEGNRVNALEVEEPMIKKVLSLRTPMKDVFEGLRKAGHNITVPATSIKKEEKYDKESSCAYHSGGIGHDIENCWDFKVRVQGLLTLGVIQARRKSNCSEEVNVIERFVLRVPPVNQTPRPEKVVITVKKPMPFAYGDTHAVPWNYGAKVEMESAAGETSKANVT